MQKRLSLIDTLKIGIQLIDHIEGMHNAGLMHCDIKPDNILLGDSKDIQFPRNE